MDDIICHIHMQSSRENGIKCHDTESVDLRPDGTAFPGRVICHETRSP